MAYSEYGITDLVEPVARLYDLGWSVVHECLELGLYEDALYEARAALDLPKVEDNISRTYLALSPIHTPVNWHIANAFSLQLGNAMHAHGYTKDMDYTALANNAHLIYRRPGFEMDPHRDEAEIGAVVTFCLSGGEENTIQVQNTNESYTGLELIGNRAILFAGNDFGKRPTPMHYVTPTISPRISMLLSHHDPILWA